MTNTITQDSIQGAAEVAAQTIVQLDPRMLLVDLNIREARAAADLVDSIRALGVLHPITVVTTSEGAHRVQIGTGAPWPRSRPADP